MVMLGACAGGPGPARAGEKVGMLTLDWATVLTVVSTVVTALATAFLSCVHVCDPTVPATARGQGGAGSFRPAPPFADPRIAAWDRRRDG